MKIKSYFFNHISLLFFSPAIFLVIWIWYFLNELIPEQLFFNINRSTVILAVAILLGLSVLLSLIFFSNKYLISRKRKMLPILLFSLYLIPDSSSMLFIYLISFLLLIQVFIQVLNSMEKQNKLMSFFNSSFIIGLIAIVNPVSVIFFLIVLTSLIIFRENTWRNWVISFCGLIFPFFIFYSMIYFFSLNYPFSKEINFSIIKPTKMSLYSIVFFFTYFSLVLISVIKIFYVLPQQKIKNRHLFLFYFFLFFICIIGFLIFSNQKLFFFMVSILPASILITNSMEYYKNNVFSFILSVLFLLLPFIYYLD